MATNAYIKLKMRFEWLNDIDDLLVVHIDAGKIKLEMVLPYDIAYQYVLNLRTYSKEPRTRKMEN